MKPPATAYGLPIPAGRSCPQRPPSKQVRAPRAQFRNQAFLIGSASRARNSHLYLPRFACADRPLAALRERNPTIALATSAGVGQGQGVPVRTATAKKISNRRPTDELHRHLFPR